MMYLLTITWWQSLRLNRHNLKKFITIIVSTLLIPVAHTADVERPSIWVKNAEREQILNKINQEAWAKAVFEELKHRVKAYATENTNKRSQNLNELPLVWFEDKSVPPTLPKFRMEGGGSKAQLTSVIKALQDGVDCGVLYFVTQESKYASCGADILYTYINALKSMDVQKEGPMNSGWMFPTDHLYEARVIGAQLPVIYDFVYPYLTSGGKVYDLATKQLTDFNFDDAQNTFKTYIWLAMNKGLLDSNWPVLESSSLVHNILALDNKAEINKYLPYYTHVNTNNQASLKMIAEKFENKGDIWPESFQYSQHVAAFSVYLMTLLDRYDPSLKLGAKYPNITGAFLSYYNLQYPNGEYPYIGDGHRYYKPEFEALEMSYLLAKLNGNKQLQTEFGNYLASSIKEGVYDRGHLHKRFYGAAPYYKPTHLLWYDNKITSTGSVDVAPPRPRTLRLEYAGMNIQRNVNFEKPIKNSLMAFVAGGSYIHGHASGMDMELYGQGHVLGIDGGKGTYRTDIHENYYRLFSAHNSVISNGASASKGGWINLGINKVEAIVTEPYYGELGVSPNHSFSMSSFYDEFNLVAPAQHQRTLSLIKISDTQGYYLDIFKAKSDHEQQYHDYVYHNIGDKVEISSAGKTVTMTDDANRYQASAEIPWVFHDKYRHPGWHFFTDVKTHKASANQFEATFSATKLGDKAIFMRAITPSGNEQEITQLKAPQAYGAAKPYNKKPLPTFILRKQGDAWDEPFVVAYESITEGEQYTINHVERLTTNGAFKGVKVNLTVKGKQLTQYIINQDTIDDVYQDDKTGIYFKGRFAIISINDKGQLNEMYIGNGKTLSYQHTKLNADSTKLSAYQKL